MLRYLALSLIVLIPLPAQEVGITNEFLTDYEIDVLRENQNPKERLAVYLKFAALRLELIDQLLASEEAGRGGKLHRNLEQYGLIIEAIDTVIDDALSRGLDMENALEGLVDGETAYLARLEKLQEAEPDDMWRYEFVLEDAVEMTRDSIELLAEDLGERKRAVIEEDHADQEQREATMSAERKKDVDREHAKEEAKETAHKSKRPTLLKPGEKLGERKR
jgi:hypothetical protein